MNFGINYNKLINWMLPPHWRQSRQIAWLRALITPLKTLHTQLLTVINTTLFEMKITGQVIKLRYALNEKYDSIQRRIIIRDAAPVEQLYTYLEIENRPIYMPFFMNGGSADFEVVAPFDLKPQDVYLRGMINRYKLPGKRYTIIYL